MRMPAYTLLLAVPVLLASCIAGMWSVNARWDEAERERHRWAPARRADRLVKQDIEALKDQQDRFPVALTPAEVRSASGERWFYRPSADRLDYELWCQVPREGAGFDALVFSPDGLISSDWPGARASPGDVWIMVDHAERAPADRWEGPINP